MDISIANGLASEGNDISFPVTLSAQLIEARTLNVTYAGVTADLDADLESSPPTTLTLPTGTTTVNLVVPTFDDRLTEPNETFTVTLSLPTPPTNPRNTLTITTATATGTIGDDDSANITIDDQTKAENEAFRIGITTTSARNSEPVNITWTVTSGTTNGGSVDDDLDLTASTGSITLPASVGENRTEVFLDIPIDDDDINENDETFTLALTANGTAPRGVFFGTSASAVLTITDNDDPTAAPDLTVDSVSVSSTSVVEGSSFTINATVNNEGNAASAATTLTYYRSADATITTGNTSIGADVVDALAANGSSPETEVVLIANAGTYYVGACVPMVSDETNTTNNCSSGVQITVTAAPDLTVESVSVSSASVVEGATFTINATVNNRGNAASALTTLTWYRSADATITTDDTSIATDTVQILLVNGRSPENAQVSIATAGTYYVGGCVLAVSGESNTDNNCSTGVQVTVTAAAVAPAITTQPTNQSVTVGGSATFTVVATGTPTPTYQWRKDGTAIAGATSATYILSNAALTDAGSYTVVVTNTASSVTSTAATLTVTAAAPSGPDLTVDGVTVSSASVVEGVSFTITATARNGGDAASVARQLRFRRSADATITTDDTSLGQRQVAALQPGGSSTQNISVSIATAGTYWVGACIQDQSQESDINNNCSTGVQVTVTAAPAAVPDLTVGSVRVSSASVVAGASFTINATVNNGGNGASAATTLTWYRSTNATITTGDTSIATDAVSALAVSGSSPENASVSIATAGTYWVGACVPTVSGETNTNNNCSTGVQVTVTAATTSGPDLTVGSVSVSSTRVVAGASFTINATVRNGGNAASAATTLTWYRSTDATITTGDTSIATDPVGALAASGSSPENASVSIATAGTWWVGACVPTVSGETNTNNNCSTGRQVTVTARPVTTPPGTQPPPGSGAPDLAIRSISAPDTVAASVSFMIDVTVENQGDRASGVSTLSYYYITPSEWEEACEELDKQDDYEVCLDEGPDDEDEPSYIEFETTVEVGGLTPGASSTHSATVSIPGPETGDYLVSACVDQSCSYNVPIMVTEAPPPAVPEPDLTVGSVGASVSRVGIGRPFMLSATVQNAGTLATAATTLRYYRSNDATITTDDTQLATAAVAALAPDAASSQSAEVSIPDSRRQPPATTTWWVGACVDAVNDEDATNNCSSAVRVEVVTQPDLIVKDARVSDATVETGTSFTVTATVENIGKRGSNHSSLHIYRSDDNTVTEADIELAVVRNVLSLPASYAANNSETYTATVSISVAGAFQIIACVIPAPSVGETDDMSNNCSNPVPVTVALPPPIPPPPPPPTPDLTVENVSVTDATLEHGASLTINATVRNRGSGASAATTLRYYISDDATITADDPQYAPRMNVGALAPGASSPESVEITILYPEGSYWLGACVGAVNEESATANNCSRGVQISVVVPDLTVTSVSVADASVAAGASFIINATVRNTGGATAAATTLRYFLSGAVTIETIDTELATTAVPALAPAASSQQSATVSIPDAGNYWISACVDPVRNETQTSDNASNCAVGVPVTVIVPSDDTDADTNAALPAILQLLLEP